MNARVASQSTRRKLQRNVFKGIKGSKWGKSCKSIFELNTFETQVKPELYFELKVQII